MLVLNSPANDLNPEVRAGLDTVVGLHALIFILASSGSNPARSNSEKC